MKLTNEDRCAIGAGLLAALPLAACWRTTAAAVTRRRAR